MKRNILAIGLFSLCCVTFFAPPAQAFFGIFSCWHPCNRYVTQITCRPYNAFTPICWGNLVCDGCCPSPCGVAGGQLPLTMGVPPWASSCGSGCCGPAPCMGGSCGAPSYASDMPMMSGQAMQMPMQMPMQQMPMQTSPPPSYQPQPNFTPPMPMPMGPNTTMQYPPMQNGVSQANYYPNYYPMTPAQQYYPNYSMPMYNPYMAWPNTQAVPYYWYGNGR
jgi:hypothetical protein